MSNVVTKIRVVLADDHAEVIAAVRRTLDESFEISGIAEDGQQAIDTVLILDPDVLVIDISMPVLDGFRAAERLLSLKCRTKIVFLTIHKDRGFVEAAFSAGASGYVTKDRLRTDLVLAIHEALLGHRFVSHSVGR